MSATSGGGVGTETSAAHSPTIGRILWSSEDLDRSALGPYREDFVVPRFADDDYAADYLDELITGTHYGYSAADYPEVGWLTARDFIYQSSLVTRSELDAELADFLSDLCSQNIISEDQYDKLYLAERPPEISASDMKDQKFDMQANPWPGDYTLNRARARRLDKYEGFTNVPGSHTGLHSTISLRPTNEKIFQFNRMFTFAKPKISHFQLRNLIAPVSRNHILYSEGTSIKNLNAETGDVHQVIGPRNRESFLGEHVGISAMAATADVVIAGGVHGEYMYSTLHKAIDDGKCQAHGEVETEINHVDVVPNPTTGTPEAVLSCNDSKVRTINLARNDTVTQHDYPWPINCTATSPDLKLRVAVGDAPETLVLDALSGDIISTIDGHKDYSFACAWGSDGYTVATGNQDMTCRIYDFRKFRDPVHIIGAQIGSFRSIKFDETSKYMIMAESVDYVTVVNTRDYSRGQVIEFWGEIAGVGFSPYSSASSDSLWIGNSDMLAGGIMHLERSNGATSSDLNDIFV